MKLRVLDWLVCPVCGSDLHLHEAAGRPAVPAQEACPPSRCRTCRAAESDMHRGKVAENACAECYGLEIESGMIRCDKGHAFPILGGVPRFSLDALMENVPADSAGVKEALSIRASFSREWGHFTYDDRTWAQHVQDRCQLALKELACSAEQLKGKVLLDAGCGNGSLSRGLNAFGCEVLAADVSQSVEGAYRHFAAIGNGRTHFIQADLMHPPFRPETYDVIYSSGVLHHNPDTRLALRSVAKSLAPGGKIYIWVYDKRPGIAHQLKELFRRTISPLPASIKHAIVFLWLPQAMLRQYLRTALNRNKPEDRLKWRERFVLLLDHYTPRYRWEHTPEELHGWYRELGYDQIATTEVRDWGFGVAAHKPQKS